MSGGIVRLYIGTVLAAILAGVCPVVYSAAEESGEKFKVVFAGLDLATVAKQVERCTKRSFLFDENQLKNKRVTLNSDTPISAAEYYRVFQAICQMNGFALVPVEGAGLSLEKIVSAQASIKEPGGQPVMVRGDTLPNGDTLMTYIVKLQNAPAPRIMALITPMLSATGSVLQVPNTELIMVNDVSSTIRRLEKLLTLLDVPGEPTITQRVQLKFIQTERAASQLSEYLQAVKGKTSDPGAGKETIAVIKDEHVNVLMLIGSEKEIKQAQVFLELIDRDAPATKRTVRYYKLKNVLVRDVVDYIGQLLGVALQARADKPIGVDAFQGAPLVAPISAPTSQSTYNQPGTTGLSQYNQPIAPASTNRPRPPPQQNRVGKSSSGANANGESPADIIPVEGLNTLVVSGDAAVHQEVEQILENLDKRKGQVMIEVAIVQVTGDESIDLGAEALSLNQPGNKSNLIDGGSGFGLGSQSDPNNRGFPTQSTLNQLSGGAFRFVQGDRLQVVLSALATKSSVAIVSQPQLLVNDNEEASFTTKMSEPTTTVTQGTATTNTSFNGFADATTSLRITPHISPDNYLNLEIVQTFEEFTGTSTGNGIPPPKVSNNATTKVSIPDRQTIVIGGFTRDTSTNNRSGIPGLMQIPGLGKLFQKESKAKQASRLYLFVRPKILSCPDFGDLIGVSNGKKADVESLSRKSKIKPQIREGLGLDPNLKVDIIPEK